MRIKRGTQFRIWANGVLRDYLLQGYALNERRLLARGVEFDQAAALLASTLERQELVTAEGQAVLSRGAADGGGDRQGVDDETRSWLAS